MVLLITSGTKRNARIWPILEQCKGKLNLKKLSNFIAINSNVDVETLQIFREVHGEVEFDFFCCALLTSLLCICISVDFMKFHCLSSFTEPCLHKMLFDSICH